MLGQTIVKVIQVHDGTPWWQVVLQVVSVATAVVGVLVAIFASRSSGRASKAAVELANQQQERQRLDRHLAGLDETRRLIGILLKEYSSMTGEPRGDAPGSITNALLHQLKDDQLLSEDDRRVVERWAGGGLLDGETVAALGRASEAITKRIAVLRPQETHVGG